jgi:hypothetical protein
MDDAKEIRWRRNLFVKIRGEKKFSIATVSACPLWFFPLLLLEFSHIMSALLCNFFANSNDI